MPILGPFIKRALRIGETLERRLPHDPVRHQHRALRRLLKKAAATTFGQYYDFKSILEARDMITAFQQQVPLFDYEQMYAKWWHMTLNQVENVSWKGRVNYFALSSGTTGSTSKHIPVTDDMLRAMRRAALRLFFAMARFDIDPRLFTKAMFMLGGSASLQQHDGYFEGDLSGINAGRVPFWIRPYYKPGTEISKITDWNARIDEVVRHAHEWDVGFIVGIPAWIQLTLEKIIRHYELETIHDLWPNLQVYVHGGVHIGPYKSSFEQLTAKPLIYVDTYLASEGFVAFQDRPGAEGMRLLLNNGMFFEFIPFEDHYFDAQGLPLEHAPALAIREVEEGVDYALVISSCAGAWRYLIGDTVRFSKLERSEIQITGRTKHYLSVCGEHLSVDNMNAAIEQVERELEVRIPEFTISAVQRGRQFSHKWYLGCDPLREKAAVRAVLDRALMAVNDDYRTERQSVLDMEVEVIPARLFYAWQEKQGKLGGQNKFPRVMKAEAFSRWEQFVGQHAPSQTSGS